jgi:hypothetical protein
MANALAVSGKSPKGPVAVPFFRRLSVVRRGSFAMRMGWCVVWILVVRWSD